MNDYGNNSKGVGLIREKLNNSVVHENSKNKIKLIFATFRI